jgi:phage baseplate assembly protein W
MEVLSIPFRLLTSGRAERVWQGSEAHIQQQAAQFVATNTGEIPMSPFYGLDDPAFRDVLAVEVVMGMAEFHPAVKVNSVYVVMNNDGLSDILVDVSGGEYNDLVVSSTTEQSVVFNA